jgi:hypothetical protein
VSFTKTIGACCCFLVVFLEVSSLEFPYEIFLATCVEETLINKWDAKGTDISEKVHSLGWEGQKEERWWKNRDSCRKLSMGCELHEL